MPRIIWTLLILGLYGFAVSAPHAVHGQIDLRQWDVHDQPELALDGEWEFAWGQLIRPPETFPQEPWRQSAGAPAYSPVPLRWTDLRDSNDQWLPAFGSATYRLRILLPSNHPPLALLLNGQASASELWVNGRQCGSMGQVSTNAVNFSARLGHLYYALPTTDTILDIRVLVANFAQHRGGFLRPLQIGNADTLRQSEQRGQLLRFFLSGGLLLMALYHLIFFLSRYKDRIHLYFTLIALTAIIRLLIPGDHLIQVFLPSWFGFEAIIRLEYVSLLVIIALVGNFLHEFYPKLVPGWIVKAFWAAAAGFGIFAILFPLHQVTRAQSVTQIINVCGGVLLLYYTNKARLSQERGAGLVLFTLIMLFAAVVNDILHARQTIHTTYLSSYAIFLLVFVQWALIAERYSKTFHMLHLQREQFLRSMADAIESKDSYTGGHVERVARFSKDLALACGWPHHRVNELYLAAMVHDVGKIGVRDQILNKPGKLDPTELEDMQKHPAIGHQMLEQLEGSSLAAQICLHHHQRWNGTGYTGSTKHPVLQGRHIPLAARIAAVADYWDAISSDRPYRQAMPIERSVQLLISESGAALDPELVELFMTRKIWLRHLQRSPSPADIAIADNLIAAQWPHRSIPGEGIVCETRS